MLNVMYYKLDMQNLGKRPLKLPKEGRKCSHLPETWIFQKKLFVAHMQAVYVA
ncbi:hypothetical protein LEMLEM_LOCUS11645 [Lemmus lemmus]